ncbi:hypothetical protein CYMTET_19095 [Cymbomonas tetramitiformis]|uniref:Uncharacterized protein n=1 Tax=Cymbomonas tetramitiformis TaxID=36881 RepID=A0AAE0G6S1_9CHLO|nr:hypothetical protein CYMTET_19095 [Cymbomonas tetramitiformis]
MPHRGVIVSHEEIAAPRKNGALRALAAVLRIDMTKLPKGLHFHVGFRVRCDELDELPDIDTDLWDRLCRTSTNKHHAILRYLSGSENCATGRLKARIMLGNAHLQRCDTQMLFALSRDRDTAHLTLGASQSESGVGLPSPPANLEVRLYANGAEEPIACDLSYSKVVTLSASAESKPVRVARLQRYLLLELGSIPTAHSPTSLQWCTPWGSATHRRTARGACVDALREMADTIVAGISAHVRTRDFALLFAGTRVRVTTVRT